MIGCHSLDTATTFLSDLEFTEVRDEVLTIEDSAGLYGLETSINQRWLAVPNWLHGGIRLIETSNPNQRQATTDLGPFAFDVYTTDIEGESEKLKSAKPVRMTDADGRRIDSSFDTPSAITIGVNGIVDFVLVIDRVDKEA